MNRIISVLLLLVVATSLYSWGDTGYEVPDCMDTLSYGNMRFTKYAPGEAIDCDSLNTSLWVGINATGTTSYLTSYNSTHFEMAGGSWASPSLIFYLPAPSDANYSGTFSISGSGKVYQSNGTYLSGVGNITPLNSTHLNFSNGGSEMYVPLGDRLAFYAAWTDTNVGCAGYSYTLYLQPIDWPYYNISNPKESVFYKETFSDRQVSSGICPKPGLPHPHFYFSANDNKYTTRSNITKNVMKDLDFSDFGKALLLTSTGSFVIPAFTYFPSDINASNHFYDSLSGTAYIKNNTIGYVYGTDGVWYVVPAQTWTDLTQVKTITIYSISNIPPTIPTSCNITNSEPYQKKDNFTASASGSTDADNDQLTYYYQFKNTAGDILQDWSSSADYNLCQYNSYCSKEQDLMVFCKAYDGQAFSSSTNGAFYDITNSPPSTPTISSFSPDPAYKTSLISATASGSSDADSESITYYYRWGNSTDNFTSYTEDDSHFECSSTPGCYRNESLFVYVKTSDGINESDEANSSINITNSKPSDISLISPENDTVVSDASPILMWSESTDADNDSINYYVCYGLLAADTCINTSQNNYTLSVTANNTYYWKVVPYDDFENGSDSITQSFYYPGQPNITGYSPANNSSSSNISVAITVNATTQSDTNIQRYEFYISTNSSNMSLVQNSTNNTYNFSAEENKYYWYSLVCDSYSCANTSEKMFTINIDVPNITINNPANNSTIENENIIDFRYTINDSNPQICRYELLRAADLYLEKSESFNCSITQQNVKALAFADYNITLYVTDGAGNSVNTTNSFSLSYTGGGGGSGAVSGGGGGTTYVSTTTVEEATVKGFFPEVADLFTGFGKMLIDLREFLKTTAMGIPTFLIVSALMVGFGALSAYSSHAQRKRISFISGASIALGVIVFAIFINIG